MDKILRGITEDKYIRFFAVDSTETVREISKIHEFSVIGKIIGGRLTSAALMIGTDIKSVKNQSTLKLNCEGPIGGGMFTSNNKGEVKGYLSNPDFDNFYDLKTQNFNVAEALGTGTLAIIKEAGKQNPYIGTVELKYKSIAQDLTYYFAQSEQIPTSIGLGVLIDDDKQVKQAGGFMIQLMPETPNHIIVKLEDNLKKFPNFTDVMDMGIPVEDILRKFILKEFELKITETIPAKFKCNCSKEKFSEGLKLLGKDELQKAIKEKEILETNCHFCNSKYKYDEENVTNILREMK
jgi:molecular chaperone Hsp33